MAARALHSASRGRADVADPLAPFAPAVRAWFEATFEAPTTAQAAGLGGHRRRPPHAHPRPDRERQDPRRVPVVPRPAASTHPRPAPDARAARRRPRPVRLAAQGADLRHRAQPPGAAGRDRPRRRSGSASRRPTISVASRTGDTPGRGAPRHRPAPAGHPHHDPGIALPDADQRRRARSCAASSTSSSTRSTRSPARKRGAHLALSLERLEALVRAEREAADAPPQRIGLSATQRPLETIARFLGGDRRRAARSTIVDAGARKPLELQVVVPVDDMAGIGEVLPLDEQPGGPATGARGADEHLAGDPPADPRADPRATAARSSSPTAGASPSGSPSGSTSSPARSSSAPITAASPASSGSRSRRSSRPAGCRRWSRRRSLELGHRHGRGRPRHPGREPRLASRAGSSGSAGPGTRSARRRKGVIFPKYRGDLLECAVVTRADARRRDRDDRRCRATRSTSSPSSSSR